MEQDDGRPVRDAGIDIGDACAIRKLCDEVPRHAGSPPRENSRTPGQTTAGPHCRTCDIDDDATLERTVSAPLHEAEDRLVDDRSPRIALPRVDGCTPMAPAARCEPCGGMHTTLAVTPGTAARRRWPTGVACEVSEGGRRDRPFWPSGARGRAGPRDRRAGRRGTPALVALVGAVPGLLRGCLRRSERAQDPGRPPARGNEPPLDLVQGAARTSPGA